MDWYYPILGGVLRGHAAHARVAAGWERFVVEGRGVRCVSDRPWVTAAETCEFVMALDAIGADEHAAPSCSRGCSSCAPTAAATGPARTSTASASTATASSTPSSSRPGTPPRSCSPPTRSAATGPTAGLFRGEGLPVGLTPSELIEAGEEIEAERRPTATATNCVSTTRSERHARTRRLPVVDTGANRPDATAACHTWNGAWPPSAGSSNTSWNTSTPARRDERRPQLVVGERDVVRVAAVDEAEPERRGPVPGDRGRVADHRDDDVLEPGVLDRAPEERQRVHAAGARVDERGVVVLPPGLVLLRAAVMVDGEQTVPRSRAAAPR